MKTNEIKEIAIKVYSNCNTCKAVATEFGKLSEMYGKDNAKIIVKTAKEMINNGRTENRENRKEVKNWFSDYNKIGLPIFREYCKDDKRAGKIASVCNNDLSVFILNWFPVCTVDGRPAKIVKGTAKEVKVSAISVRSIIRACFDNIVRSYIGMDTHKIVTID